MRGGLGVVDDRVVKATRSVALRVVTRGRDCFGAQGCCSGRVSVVGRWCSGRRGQQPCRGSRTSMTT